MSTASHYRQIAELRLLVGALGERDNYGWWPTSFFSQSAKMFLEPVFPRTSILAQYHGILEAARRTHDEHLSAGSFHTFRLPEEVEQDIQNVIASLLPDEIDGLLAHDRDSRLESLRVFADTQTENAEGPFLCGNAEDVLSGSALPKLASIYHGAFERGTHSYPYFEVSS
ncbi:BrxE family protein [Nioella aestuarii]|uniref:BrxE family protein n=1 Tax=Nioella aestuarii TaxID=1662864 RepID=UPI003D7FE7FC